MRICITRSEKYAYSETFIRDQIQGLKKHTDVYTIHSGRYPERDEDGTPLSPKFFWLIHKALKIVLGRNNYFSDYGVCKSLKKNKIDLVFANYGMSGAHMVAPCKKEGVPLMAIFHGHDATDRKLLEIYRTKYQKLFLYASGIIVVSKDMKKQLLSLGAPLEKLHLIPYGIDIDRFQKNTSSSKNKNFIAVGRFTDKKAPLLTIQAFHKVQKQHPDATLTMVGGKTGLYEECLKLTHHLGLSDNVNFTGILPSNEISELMKSSLAFVQHSITAKNGDMEGTPLSVLEAGASGIPVISTLHAGIKDAVIHEKSGFLVAEKDVDLMAAYMIKLCDHPEQAIEMGKVGRDHIEQNYNQKVQIKKIYQIIQKAVNTKY